MSEKIHFVHFDAGPGGMEVLLPLIIKNLQEKYFSAFVIRPERKGRNVYKNSGIIIKYGSNINAIAYCKFFLYALKYRNDIFHVYNIGPVFLLLLKLAGVKTIIYSIHGTIYWRSPYKKIILHLTWKAALNKKIIFIANSQHSRDEFLKKVNNKVNVRILYNPIDTNRFKPLHLRNRCDEIRIIYAGRLDKGKNLHTWIETGYYVHSKMTFTRFELYGGGSLKKVLQQKITDLHADEFIHLMGFKADIENIYRNADLMLFLSDHESFGNVVVESIFCETPVITLPIPSMLEIFKDFPEFILNETGNIPEQVCSKLNRLDDLKVIARKARENFIERFSQQKHIHSLKEIYSAAK